MRFAAHLKVAASAEAAAAAIELNSSYIIVSLSGRPTDQFFSIFLFTFDTNCTYSQNIYMPL